MSASLTNLQIGLAALAECRVILADENDTRSPMTQALAKAWAAMRPHQRVALLALAGIEGNVYAKRQWKHLTGKQRAAVVLAMREMQQVLGAITSAIHASQTAAMDALKRAAEKTPQVRLVA